MGRNAGFIFLWLLLAAFTAGTAAPVTFTETETVLARVPGTVEREDIKISSDGRHTAYPLPRDGKYVIVVDGKEGPVYEPVMRRDEFTKEVLPYLWFRLGNDGQVSYLARRGKQQYLVVNGTELPAYDEISPFFLHQGEGQLFYEARRGKKWFVVMNGVEGPACDEVTLHIGYMINGQPTYFARRGKKHYYAIGEELGPAFNDIYWATVSRDRQHYAFSANRGKKGVLVVDGKETVGVDASFLSYSPDGQRLVYVAVGTKQHHMVVDGKPGPDYDYVSLPVFSPDSRRFAYLAQREKKQYIVLDGEEGPAYDRVWRAFFSPDSRSVAYSAKRDEQVVIVKDGQEVARHGGWFTTSLVFSPGGGHLAYFVHKADGGRYFAIDGVEGQSYQDNYRDPKFTSPTELYFIAIKSENGEHQVVKVDVTVKP